MCSLQYKTTNRKPFVTPNVHFQNCEIKIQIYWIPLPMHRTFNYIYTSSKYTHGCARARTHSTLGSKYSTRIWQCCASTCICDTNNQHLLYVPMHIVRMQIFSLSNIEILRESDTGKVHRVKLFCQIVFVLLPFHDKQ